MEIVDLDNKDEIVLRELKHDAKATTGKIAKRTGIPVTTVHNRIKRLEREGVITQYVPVIDYARIGQGIHTLIFVTAENKLPDGSNVDQEELAKKLLRLPGVQKANILTGGYDLFIEARLGSVDELNNLLIKEVRKLSGVDKTQTMLVLQDVN